MVKKLVSIEFVLDFYLLLYFVSSFEMIVLEIFMDILNFSGRIYIVVLIIFQIPLNNTKVL